MIMGMKELIILYDYLRYSLVPPEKVILIKRIILLYIIIIFELVYAMILE